MCKISSNVLLNDNELFSQFKGALTEQYVFQQLRMIPDLDIFYWSAENLQAKSLNAFVQKYPKLHGIRISLSKYREQEFLTNRPLYAVKSMIE